MDQDSKSASLQQEDSFSVLDHAEEGVVVAGIKDNTISPKSGEKFVAATIQLDKLEKNDVMKILKVLEPYESNINLLTKKDLSPGVDLGSLGVGLKDSAEILQKDLSLDASAQGPTVSLDGLNGKLNGAQGLGVKISEPTLNGDLPSLSLNKPSTDAGATFKMPSAGLTMPDIKSDSSGTLKVPDINVSAPNLNAPIATLDINKPEVEGKMKREAPKFTMPRFSLPHLDAPKADIDVSGDPGLPSVSGSMERPDLNLSAPKLDLNSPDVNVKAPDANIEAPSGKIKWPHLKWKGQKLKGPDANLNADLSTPNASISTPKIDGDLSTPDVNVGSAQADIKGPDLDVQTPDLNVDAPSGKINWPHLKWKKPKLEGSKADLDVDADLKKPDLSLSAPKIEGDINVPNAELSLPETELKAPGVDVHGPDADIDAPSGKINWPHLKWKKSKLNGPKADMDLNADLSPPDASVPEIDGEISTPDVSLNLPKADVDIKAPDADINPPSGKIKFPTLKKPKFLLDVDADLQRPDLGLSVPDVNAKLPNADLTAPNVELKASDLSLSAPKIEGDIGTPGIDAGLKTGIDLSAPKTNINIPDQGLSTPKIEGPNVNVGLPGTDIKAPSLHLPKADLQSSDLSLKTPNVNLYPPKIGGSLSAPNIDTSMPKIELEAPDANVKSPDLDVNLPKADLKDSNIQLKTPDLDLNSHLGDFKMPHYNHPKLDLSSPEVEAPSINPTVEAGIKVPGVSTDMPTTDAHISVPAVDLNAPNVGDIKGPNVDVKAPDVDASLEKPKMPHFKIPKFSLFGSKPKSPETNARADLEGSGSDSDVVEVPVFKFHRLPQTNIDGIEGITDALRSIKSDSEEKDYVFSKGIRLPVVNATANGGEKIDILERLKIAREKASSVNVSPTEEKTDIDLQHTGAGLDANTGAGDSSLVRGGTFKVDKPESTLGLTVPDISTSDESDKYSLSLSNMLCLNVKDSDAN
ncbi:neuroblast differentiation-associated protein AHNAK [Neolamprologus brichardi]|uniref:neuroblast differentiation-associated protein AHNAK n=1 Tax=Neolamprologus brichardi TaxID=32507 RepID=UPI001643C678|nr:neuroblast differentiation-associated protein AHNAK [Neolamprologus brichardi]